MRIGMFRAAAMVVNVRLKLMKRETSISILGNKARVRESEAEYVYSDPARALNRYCNGRTARIDQVANRYGLHMIDFSPGDLALDVGANYGDVSDYLLGKGLNVVAMEPNPSEAELLKVNFTNLLVLQCAASNRRGEGAFFLGERGGDSSLLRHPNTTSEIKVREERIDELFADMDIKLIKIDAEGFEPEVLSGCKGIMSRVEYFAIESGPERGLHQETTVDEVRNFLSEHAFIEIFGSRSSFTWLYMKSQGSL